MGVENPTANNDAELLQKKKELLLKRKALLEEQTRKNLEATQAIVEGIPNRLASYGGKALTAISDVSNIVLQKVADLVPGAPPGARPLSSKDLTEPAQRWSEYFAKRGIPGGASFSDYWPSKFAEPRKGEHWYTPEKGGALDWNIRDIAGGALDILGPTALAFALERLGFDPAKKALANIVAEANKTGKLDRTLGDKLKTQVSLLPSLMVSPGKTYSKYFGGRSYMKAFEPIDRYSLQYGKEMVSPEFLENNVFFGPAAAQKFVDKKVETTWEKAKQLAKDATAQNPVQQHFNTVTTPGTPAVTQLVPHPSMGPLGVQQQVTIKPAIPPSTSTVLSHETGGVDMAEAMKPVNAWLQTKMVKGGRVDPGIEAQWKVLQDLADNYSSLGRVNVDKATEMMANIYRGMPGTAYEDAVSHGFGVNTSKEMAKGFKQQINAVSPELDKAREEAGKWLTIQKPVAKWAKKESEIPIISPSDLKPTGQAIQKGGNYAGAVSFKAIPTALKVSRFPGTRMTVGGIANKMSSIPVLSDVIDQTLRQGLIKEAYPDMYPTSSVQYDPITGERIR